MKQPSTQKTLQWQCTFLVTFIQSAPWRTPDHLEYCAGQPTRVGCDLVITHTKVILKPAVNRRMVY